MFWEVNKMNSFVLLDKYINFALANNRYNSCIIKGRSSTGKTTNVLRKVKEKAEGNYVYLNGHLTPKEMFNCYKDNPDAVVILDDIDALLDSAVAVGLLKSACTENSNGERRIFYASSRDEEIYSVFRGKTFLLCNNLPKNPDLIAIGARSICYNFEPSNIEIITEIQKMQENDAEVVTFLSQLFAQNNLLNFRHYFKAKELKEMYPTEWRELTLPLLNLSDRYGVLQSIISNSSLSVEEQATLYEKETGKSRASFFRDKKRVV